MKEKNVDKITEETPSATVKHPYRTRFVALITALTLLVLGAATLILFTFVDFSEKEDGSAGTSQNTGYAYSETDIADYIALNKNMVTGLVVPGADSKLSEVTDESIKTSINQQLLAAVALTEEQKTNGQYVVKRTEKIGYADEIRLHVLYVTDASGEYVVDDYFSTAYVSSGFFQVGMEFFGKDFDDKLIGLVPKDTGYYEVRTYGSVAEDDVICLTYTVTEKIPASTEGGEETTKTHVDVTGERIDLSRKDKAWRDLLLESYGTVGQSFTFDYEEDIDDDGDEETVTYTCVVSSVLTEEASYALTATLPEDYFSEKYAKEELVALNGRELTFYINVEFMIDHEANTWETMTLTDMINTLSFSPTKKDDLDAARAECIAELKKQAEKSNEETEPTLELSLIWNYLLDTLDFTGELPKEALEEAVSSAKEQTEYYYNYYSSSDELFVQTFPNIDLYAASSYMWGYDAKEYDGYVDYIESYYAPRLVKQALLVYGIYNTCFGDEAAQKKAYDAAYEELMQEIIDANTTESETVTREEVVAHYGEAYLREQTIARMVNDYLVEKNRIDWEK